MIVVRGSLVCLRGRHAVQQLQVVVGRVEVRGAPQGVVFVGKGNGLMTRIPFPPPWQQDGRPRLALDLGGFGRELEQAPDHGPEHGHAGADEDAARLRDRPDEVVDLPGLVGGGLEHEHVIHSDHGGDTATAMHGSATWGIVGLFLSLVSPSLLFLPCTVLDSG